MKKIPFPLPMIIPPPLWFVLVFLLSLWLNSKIPMEIPASNPPLLPWLGLMLITVGAVFVLSSAVNFAISRTTIVPHGTAKKLICRGTYRFTRNPMYLGMTVIYVGVALRLGVVWPLILLVIPTGVVNFVVIPFEEKKLGELFGEQYSDYCNRVRRWI